MPGALTRRGTLARRVVVASAVVLVGTGVAGVALVSTALDLRSAQLRQVKVLAAAQQSTERLLNDFVDEETGLRGFLITGSSTFLAPARDAAAAIPDRLDRLRLLAEQVPGAAARLDDVAQQHRQWAAYAQALTRTRTAGPLDPAEQLRATAQGKELFDALRVAVAGLAAVLTSAADGNQARVAGLQQRLVAGLVASMGLLVLTVVAGTAGLLRFTLRPVQELAQAVRAVAAGNLSEPIPASGAPEMRSMATDVRVMRDRLLADTQAAARAVEALEQQSPAVFALRQALAAPTVSPEGLDVAGRIVAAEGVLAGDWYDLITLPGSRLGLVLGDVAGHGPVSAVLALRLKHALSAALRSGAGPALALAETSRTLVDVAEEMFATVLVVTVDPHADRLSYANAGHPGAVLIRAGDGEGEPTADVELSPTGPLLSSVLDGATWTDAHHPLHVGDAVLAFSDGVLEARNGAGEQYGLDGLLASIRAHHLTDADHVVDVAAAAVIRHRGPATRHDDQTLLYVRRIAAVTHDDPVAPASVLTGAG